jgi:hypothetical protein
VATLPDGELSIAFDLHGCPNRCRHCWLGRASGATLDLGETMVRFQTYRDWVASGDAPAGLRRIRFFGTWLREPDYAPSYRELYRTEMEQNGGSDYRKDYELLSVWRLARDESYARWAREIGVTRCQVTLFGMEETTDWFYRRRGAFRDVVEATRRLLDAGIVPRWQLFQTTRILPELGALLSLADELDLAKLSAALGREFVVFMHDAAPMGEALEIEELRLRKRDLESIPQELIASTARHMRLTDSYHTEAEWIARIREADEGPVGIHPPPVLWLQVDSRWDVYSNVWSLEPWWRLGNMAVDAPEAIVGRYLSDAPAGCQALLRESVRSLAANYGDPAGDRIFMSKDDLVGLYLERHLRQNGAR